VHWPIWRVKVAEWSMEPALRPGDWLLVRRTRRIRPGQIVVARHPGRAELLIVKRAARRVGGGWWLESDNPGAGAVDSRRFGAVTGDLIEGRVLVRYWRPRSLSRTGGVSRPAARERPRLATGPFRVCGLSGGRRSRAAPALHPAC
jgi:nickel-type superoxide dismutase maturation protease